MKTIMGLAAMAMAAMGMQGATTNERQHEPKKSKERSGAVLDFRPFNAPIHLQNNSQKAKSKRLVASNRKQGRV